MKKIFLINSNFDPDSPGYCSCIYPRTILIFQEKQNRPEVCFIFVFNGLLVILHPYPMLQF